MFLASFVGPFILKGQKGSFDQQNINRNVPAYLLYINDRDEAHEEKNDGCARCVEPLLTETQMQVDGILFHRWEGVCSAVLS